MKHWAERMDQVAPSATVAMAQKVREDKAKGVEIFDFTVGEPHCGTPEIVKEGVKRGLDRGQTKYSDSKGLPELRKLLAADFQAKGIPATDANILVTPGGKQAIFYACLALLNPGDEAIVIPPCWVSYADIIKLAGGVPVEVNTSAEACYRPTEEALRAAITPKTKIIMTNNPSNPTGAVWEPEVVEMVARVAAEHDLWVIDDLVYEAFNYTGRPVPAIGALEPTKERTITVGSFSKAYAMTGFRVGYMYAPGPIINQLLKLQVQSATCLPAFVQEGAITALKEAQDFPVATAKTYERLRDIVKEELGDIHAGPLEGAFYAFVDITSTGMSDTEFCSRLYDEHRVATVQGSAFGTAGKGRVRVSYAAEENTLREGMRRLASAIKAWSRTGAQV